MANGVRQMLLEENFRIIIKAYKENNIPFIALKGSYLVSLLYPFGIRATDDIDILIRYSDFKKTDSLMKDMGYNYTGINMSINLHKKIANKVVYSNPDKIPTIPFDIHFTLGPYPYLGRVKTKDIWTGTELCDTPFKNITVLSGELLLIHLLLHSFQDIKEENVHSYFDIINYLRKYSSKIDWEKFMGYVIKFRVELPVSYAINEVHKLEMIRFPDDITERIKKIKSGDMEMKIYNLSLNRKSEYDKYLLQFLSTPGIIKKMMCIMHILLPARKYINVEFGGRYSLYYKKIISSIFKKTGN
jgi:hypothetical protein